jgi:hypothetical protein
MNSAAAHHTCAGEPPATSMYIKPDRRTPNRAATMWHRRTLRLAALFGLLAPSANAILHQDSTGISVRIQARFHIIAMLPVICAFTLEARDSRC